MTLLSRFMNLFPALHLVCIVAASGFFITEPSVGRVFLLFFCIYLLPLLSMKIHNYFHPVKNGISNLATLRYSAWWGSHQIQGVFNAIPVFEAILRLIPGAYSSWLRLWGSTIGQKIYWTSRVEITDRSLMIIGNHVIFGHKIACYAHVIVRKKAKILLYVKPITIGDHVFIGAGSRLGPGTSIAAFTTLPLLTDLKINQNMVGEALCLVGE
jgi:acetyltransferase-like isoleucine patch superfamily enzyme